MTNLIGTSPHERITSGALSNMMHRHSQICRVLGSEDIGPCKKKKRKLTGSVSRTVVEVRHPLFALNIYPSDTDELISWAVPSGPELPFCAITDKAIVYLRVPVVAGSPSDITMQDSIYWICDEIVVAAGVIEEVMHTDVIVNDDFLIVPVVAVPFIHRFKPFTLVEAAAYYMEDFYEKYKPMAAVPPAVVDDPFSWLAVDMCPCDGSALLEFIQEDFRSH